MTNGMIASLLEWSG